MYEIKRIEKEITRYQTQDGRQFATEEKAKQHIESLKKAAEKRAWIHCDQLYNPDENYSLSELATIVEKLISIYGKNAILRHDAGYNNITADIKPEAKRR